MKTTRQVLNEIPRALDLKEGFEKSVPAVVYIDHTGDLIIALMSGDVLRLDEEGLYNFVSLDD